MTTILFVLSFAVLAFYVVGAVSVIWDTKLSPFFEFFIEFNGWIITTLAAVNSLLLVFAVTISALGSTQVLILLAYIAFCLASIATTIYKFKKG